MRTNRIILFLIAFGLASFANSGSADADQVYTLNYDSCTGGCSTNGQGSSNDDFGYIDLQQVNSSTVLVTVQLNTSVALDTDFVDTGNGSIHTPLAFNVDKSITISNLSPSTYFTVGPSPDAISGLGTFSNTIACTSNCPQGGGGGDTIGDQMIFTTTDGSTLSLLDFVPNSSGFYFAADVIGPSGNTGEVAVSGPGTSTQTTVPEPSAITIFGSALLGLGLLRRRSLRSRAARPVGA